MYWYLQLSPHSHSYLGCSTGHLASFWTTLAQIDKHFAWNCTSRTTPLLHLSCSHWTLKTTARENKQNLSSPVLSCCLYFKTCICQRINTMPTQISPNTCEDQLLWAWTMCPRFSLWHACSLSRSVGILHSQPYLVTFPALQIHLLHFWK